MLAWRARQYLSLYTPATQIALAVVVGLTLGSLSLMLSPVFVLVALAGAGGAILVLKRPELFLLGILVFSSTIIEEANVPTLNLFVLNLYITEAFLIAGFVLIIARALAERNFKLIRTPLDGLLIGFLVIAMLTTLRGIFSGVEMSVAISEIRIVTYYATFFVVTNLVRDESQLKLLIYGMFGLALVVASAMFLQFTLGDSIQILPGRVEHLVTTGAVYDEVTRIVSVGEGLVLVAFITMMTIVCFSKFTFRAGLGFLLAGWVGMAVIITFNRNFWIAVILAMFALFWILPRHQRSQMIGWWIGAAVMVVIVLLSVFALPGGERAQTLVTASADRMFSLADGANYESDASTLRWRNFEYEYAVPTILENPLIGIGLGARYRPTLDGVDGYEFNGQHYIHNAHLWILMKTGVPGYAFFMALGLVFVGRGLRYWSRIASPLMKGTILGYVLTYLGVMVGSIVNPIFMQWYWTPILGIMMGTNEVILRNFVRDANENG
jgi:hypothetical protein